MARTAAEFDGVRVVSLRRRGGFCIAANAGIRAARGHVVELLNDDTEVCPGWAEAALAHFREPTVAAVAPLVLWGDGDRIDSAGDRYYRGGIAGKRGHGERLSAQHLLVGRVFGASASSAFYCRELLLKVGAFPESFGAYFEDVDLSFRLWRAGGEVVYEPASRVRHRVSASYGQPRRDLLERQSRNEELVFWRNMPLRDLLRSLPLHLAVVAAKAGRRWSEGQLLPFVLGRLAALARLPEVVRHRRQLHSWGPTPPVAGWGVEPRYWGP